MDELANQNKPIPARIGKNPLEPPTFEALKKDLNWLNCLLFMSEGNEYEI